MDWNDAVKKLKDRKVNRENTYPKRPESLGSYDALEVFPSMFPYSKESLVDSVEEQHLDGYEEEVKRFIEVLDGDVVGAELAAGVKLGMHFKGYHIGYEDVVEAQGCDVSEKTVYRKANELKDYVGVDERLEWPEVRRNKPKTVQ